MAINRRHLLALAAGALGIAAPVLAQGPGRGRGPGGPGGRGRGRFTPDEMLKRLTAELKLTADQQRKIKPILEKQSREMQALFQNQQLPMEQRFERMRALRESTAREIRRHLTPEQQRKYDQMLQQRRGRFGGGRGPGGPGRGPGGPGRGARPE